MRRRLAVVALATTAMVTIAFVVPLGSAVRSLARERALAQAREVTQILVPALALADAPTSEVAMASATSRAPGDVTAVTVDGRVLGAPVGADPAFERARDGEAFVRAAGDGLFVYTPVLAREPGRTAVIRVHVPDEVLRRGVYASWVVLGLLGVALVGAAVLVADRLGRSTVAATREVAGTARELSSGRLEARARPDGPPEVADVAAALNGLADRIQDLLAAEREAAADLSHRLRTPLTALRVDITELDDSEMSRRLAGTLDDLERQIDRVIHDTRRPADRRSVRFDASEVVAERAAFWAPLAEDQDRGWTVDLSPGADVEADPDELAAALDALFGNVFAHTPEGTACRISVAAEERRVRISVEDEGPGFADAAILQRGASGSGSTGLGLDIARRTARQAGGRLAVGRSSTGGAEVVLDLPRA